MAPYSQPYSCKQLIQQVFLLYTHPRVLNFTHNPRTSRMPQIMTASWFARLPTGAIPVGVAYLRKLNIPAPHCGAPARSGARKKQCR